MFIGNNCCNIGISWPTIVKQRFFVDRIEHVTYSGVTSFLSVFQGIWLCEHRDHPTGRNIVVTMNGM